MHGVSTNKEYVRGVSTNKEYVHGVSTNKEYVHGVSTVMVRSGQRTRHRQRSQ